MSHLVHRSLATIVSLTVLAASTAFAQGDENLVSAETRSYATERLDRAEAAFAAGDIETAWKVVEEAARAPTKFHGRGLAVISSRALGDEIYGRIYDLRRRMRIAQGQKAEAQGLLYERPDWDERSPWRWDNRSALTWYIGAPDPDAVLRLLERAPADRDVIMSVIGSISVNDDGEIVYGAGRAGSGVAIGHEPLWDRYEPLPVELELQRRYRNEVIPAVFARVRNEADKLLAREKEFYESPPTEMEQRILDMNSDFAGASEAMTGFRDEEADPELQLLLDRTDESRELLDDAKDWLLLIPQVTEKNGDFGFRTRGGQRVMPVVERATSRATDMMAIGEDTSVPVMARADAYEAAQGYYRVADARDKADLTYEKRSALQPAIDEYLARRNAAKDAAQEKFAEQAAEMEQAMKDMEKTEEEKEAFKEEADALEDELGF